ncbi:MAG: M15 family metallopeptidase [Pseudomonadota bacterium]
MISQSLVCSLPVRRLLGAALGLAALCPASLHAQAAKTVSLAERLEVLKQAYPSAIRDVSGGTLRLATGAELVIDDGRQKSHQDKLKNADIEDMLSQVYPLGQCETGKPARNFDPGRIRSDAFMRAVYGNSRSAVARTLVSIPWFGSTVQVTRVAGADKALRAVAADLAKLPTKYRRVFAKSAGTFNWRLIAGTRRLSVHSFAAAIDVNTKYADYWRWSGGQPGNVPTYRNKIPRAVVDVFERHGFIWGGKWYHYDTMHFEFRPALIAIARLFEKRGCGR